MGGVREKEGVGLALRANLEATGGPVLEDWPPILTRSGVWGDDGDGAGLGCKEFQEGAQKNERWEGVSVLGGADGLSEDVDAAASWVREGGVETQGGAGGVALDV